MIPITHLFVFRLLTPPGTPLFPSLEMESQKSVMSQIGTPKVRTTAPESRVRGQSLKFFVEWCFFFEAFGLFFYVTWWYFDRIIIICYVESGNVTINTLVSQEDLILIWAISLLGGRTSSHQVSMENEFLVGIIKIPYCEISVEVYFWGRRYTGITCLN